MREEAKLVSRKVEGRSRRKPLRQKPFRREKSRERLKRRNSRNSTSCGRPFISPGAVFYLDCFTRSTWEQLHFLLSGFTSLFSFSSAPRQFMSGAVSCPIYSLQLIRQHNYRAQCARSLDYRYIPQFHWFCAFYGAAASVSYLSPFILQYI